MEANPTPVAGYVLPCGRDVEGIWARLDDLDLDADDGDADDGAEAHDRTCPHCRAAAGSLTVLRRWTGELVADDAVPSPLLTGRIMAAVRAEVRRHDMLALPTGQAGPVRVSEEVAASVLRFAADAVTGVRARRCRITASTGDQVPGDLDASRPDQAVDIEMSVAVSYSDFTRHALDDVRDRVSAVASARIGLRINRLNLTLEDLYDA